MSLSQGVIVCICRAPIKGYQADRISVGSGVVASRSSAAGVRREPRCSCEIGQGRGPERARDQRGLQPSLPNFGCSKSASIYIRCKSRLMRRAAFLR